MFMVEQVCAQLQTKRRLALVSVVSQLARRHAGAAMLCDADGLVAGSIGGGILEKEVIERARAVAAGKGVGEFLDSVLTCDAAGNGMSCGGSVRLFIEPLEPDGATRVLFDRLRVAREHQDDMFTLTPVTAPGQRRALRTHAGKWPLPIALTAEIRKISDEHGLVSPAEIDLGLGRHFVLIPWPASDEKKGGTGGRNLLPCAP